jgi:hypothetical protein
LKPSRKKISTSFLRPRQGSLKKKFDKVNLSSLQ